MTLEEKVGQLFIISLYNNKGAEEIERVRTLIKNYPIGGLILMQEDPVQHALLLNEFNTYQKVPLLVGVDAEWGLYQRFPSAKKFPWALTLGAIQDKRWIKKMATQIATDCKSVGIHWNFAPVVDVNTNPKNPIIGNRSFGSDVSTVVRSASAYVDGLQQNGILSSLKHFPGHGDTDLDSHVDLPILTHDIDRLKKVELAPFKKLIRKRPAGIMVAHMYVPQLEKQKGVPASLSHSIITDLLKNKLHYKGIIITDALNMGAIKKSFRPGEAALRAIMAGNDILLFSEDPVEGQKQIISYYISGKISESRLKESVIKILKAKYEYGASPYSKIEISKINLHTQRHDELALNLYKNALTLLKNERNSFPYLSNTNSAIHYDFIALEESKDNNFVRNIQTISPNITIKSQDGKLSPNPLIIGIFKDNSSAYKSYKISQESLDFIKKASKIRPVHLLWFGSPYGLEDVDISSVKSILVAYEANDDAYKAVLEALQGDKISGRLPVTVNQNIPSGKGITRRKISK